MQPHSSLTLHFRIPAQCRPPPAPRQDFIPCQGTWPVDFVREAALSIRQPGLANHQLELPPAGPQTKSAAPDGPAGTSEPSLRQAWALGQSAFCPDFFFLARDVITKTSESRQVRNTARDEGKHQSPGGELQNRYNRGCLSGSINVSTPMAINSRFWLTLVVFSLSAVRGFASSTCLKTWNHDLTLDLSLHPDPRKHRASCFGQRATCRLRGTKTFHIWRNESHP